MPGWHYRSAWCVLNSAILFHYLRKHGIYQPEPGWVKFSAKVGIAVLTLAIALWFGMGTEQSWLTSSGWPRILRLSALVAGGVVIYFAVLAALGFRPKIFPGGLCSFYSASMCSYIFSSTQWPSVPCAAWRNPHIHFPPRSRRQPNGSSRADGRAHAPPHNQSGAAAI